MPPTVPHVGEVLDDTMLHGLSDLKIVSKLLCLSAHHDILDLSRCCIPLFDS